MLRFLDGLIRTDAKRSKVGPAVTMIDPLWCTSVLLDPRAFLYKHVLFFFFFLNCFCVWIMTVSTFTSDIRYASPCFFLSPRIVRGKKKRKSYKQIVRARQSALNNIPDSQDRYARAKLWLGLCKKRACCNMLPSEINAILIPFCFLYRSDFSIVRYKYNKIVTIARRKRSFVSEDVLECDKSSYFFYRFIAIDTIFFFF